MKAFNLISRVILAQTGSKFGVPARVVDLHQAFLHDLTRSFRVAQQISPGIGLTAGFLRDAGFLSVRC